MREPELQGPVVLFDGVCNLCNAAVRFVKARDRLGAVRLASLQSEEGRALLERYGLQLRMEPEVTSAADAGTAADAAGTMVLIEGGQAFVSSTAALRLTRHLGGAWPLLSALLIVPAPLRDAVYGFVARNRYRWFGAAACEMTAAE